MRFYSLARRVRTGLYALLLAAPLGALAQAFPAGTITMVVPYPPGNTTDILCRLVMKALSERINQPVVVVNRAGAGGVVGTQSVRLSAPDGYTIGLIASGHAIQPWLDKAMPFDVRKDFTLLNLIYTGQYLLAVSAAMPAKSLAEFVTWARANPGKVFYGSTGQGTASNLGGELIKQVARIDMTHIPYKGSTEVFQAVVAGDIHAYLDLMGTVEPHLKTGRLRVLATLGKQRRPGMPDVPALSETYPGVEVLVWTALVAPPGLPKNVNDKLVAELGAVFAAPELRARFNELGTDAGGLSGTDLARFVSGEFDRWGKVVQASGIKVQ